jgi:hypothetical protein
MIDARKIKLISSPMPFFTTIVTCATIKSRREFQLELSTGRRKYSRR